MERITRTITTSTIYPGIVNYDPDTATTTIEPIDTFTVNGKVSNERALTLTRKRIKSRTLPIVIRDIVYDATTYSMSIEDFIEYAERM